MSEVCPKDLARVFEKCPGPIHAWARFSLAIPIIGVAAFRVSAGTATPACWIAPLLLGTVLLWGVASAVWANAPPPVLLEQAVKNKPPIPLKDVLVETTEKGDSIRLVLPRRPQRSWPLRASNRVLVTCW